MIRNYLKIAWRNLFKHKGFSFINIIGLALGMASSLVILQYVRMELSYDTFQKNAGNTYRLKQDRYDQGKLTTEWAAGTAGIAQTVKEGFPEVEAVTKMTRSRAVTSYKDKVFREEQMYYVYDNFLDFFSCKVIKGNAATALKDPNSIVLTRSAAKKYFGNEEPIGKLIIRNNTPGKGSFKVSAVIEDAPANTHFKYTVLLPFSRYVLDNGPACETSFGWDGFYSYLRIKPGSDIAALESKINKLAQKKLMEERPGSTQEKIEFRLQPLKDIHLYSNYMMEAEVNGDGKTVYFLGIIALFIIVIAWINYVNLSTARSVDRAKEVGVRKVMGSFRSQLIAQFMFEAVLINILSTVVCLILIVLCLPLFNNLTGKQLDYGMFSDMKFWLTLLALFFIGTLFSGFYPSFALSSFMPVEVLKGRFSRSSKGSFLRQALVVVQFSAAVILIAGTFAVYSQLKFMRTQDLGMNIDQTLIVKGPNAFDSLYATRFTPFKDELAKIPGIAGITASSIVPGKKVMWNAGGVKIAGSDPNKTTQIRPIGIDHNYMDFYGLKLLKGRMFSKQIKTDPDAAVLMNEEVTTYFGFKKPEDALNKQLDFWGNQYTIIGIVSNHHQESLKEKYDGHVYRLIPDIADYYSLKLDGNKNNYEATISSVKDLWGRTFPENPFEYFFLDDNFQKQYDADRNFGKTFALFSVLAIVIACLGLLGLASFITTQRTKEIGIRKILGASVPAILYKLTSDFIKPIIVSVVVAIPVTYYLLNNWLQNYAFRIGITPLFFILPVVLVFLVAVLTMATQTVKAASSNPVKSLRTE
ncbi:MAG: ABC transporter permease [Bacteroidia bacterium]